MLEEMGRTSWGAVAGGALVAVSVYLVLALLGLGLGLGAVDVVQDEDARSGAITGGVGLWWTVSALLAFFLGGWMAGRLGGGPFILRGLFSGVFVWALGTLVSFWLVTTTISTLLGGPLAVATDSVYAVLREVEVHAAIEETEPSRMPRVEAEDLDEERAETARRLAARAEGAMEAGLWAAFTLLLGAGAAVAGAWFATEPPAWSRPRRTT